MDKCVLLDHEVVPRLPRGTLNRGAVCVCMHLRPCADLKEPGWPSESLGVRKQADTQHACDFCKQKTAEVGTAGPMWRISAAVRKPLILIGWSWECSANKQTNWEFTTFWLGFNYRYTCTFYFVSLLRRSQTTCQLWLSYINRLVWTTDEIKFTYIVNNNSCLGFS